MKIDTKRLRPSPAAIVALARRETDPAAVREFDPIVRGPVVAVVLLAGIGAFAVARALVVLVAAALGDARK